MTLQEVQALFPEAVWSASRGKVYLHGMNVSRLLDGIPISFTRRRYSNATFTWADAFINGQWVSLGDPWPCVNPPTKALREEVRRRTEQNVYQQGSPS